MRVAVVQGRRGGKRAFRANTVGVMPSFAPRAGLPWLALVTLTAAGAAAAAGYALTAPKQYRATAQLLVAPTDDAAFTGIVGRPSRAGRRFR